jgi:ArsR family transcriptional regulator
MEDSLHRFKADLFRALGHPTRIAIVEALRDGEMPAGKLIYELALEQANPGWLYSGICLNSAW